MTLYEEITANINSGKSFVLATITKTTGSTPREIGAKMLIYPNGSISSTVGGGDFERMVIEDSLKLFSSDSSTLLKKYTFAQTGENATGMCCGGAVEVFLEKYLKPHHLVVFGGGHVCRALVNLCGQSEFKISVIDDRKDILDAFGEKVETRLTNKQYNENICDLNENSFIVIVSRSHQIDYMILKNIISHNYKYLGMIGSKAKISKMFTRLKDDGVDQKLLDKVLAPIGLNIGSEGPYEIAVSILAQLIAVKNETK
jgi:xanthine dehydrogenase accessory factor